MSEIPWLVEGGAKHSVQVARNLAFMAAGGTEGIVLGADLEVRERAVPDGNVRVFPGTAAIKNRASGAQEEVYVFRRGSEVVVPIAPTDASGTRSDLIVARIENPWASGETWPDPSDPTVGPYDSLAVISNVDPATTRAADLGLLNDHSMIALARVDMPISTATVEQAYITDLRVMSNSVSKRESDIFAVTGSETLTSATYEIFPDDVSMAVDIPEWATHARVKAILAGVADGQAVGDLRILIGSIAGDIAGQPVGYNVENNTSRITMVTGAPRLPIPAAARGGASLVRIQGRKTSGAGSLTVDDKTTVFLDVEYINQPESNV